MKHPQDIKTIKPGAIYSVPQYEVTNEGIVDHYAAVINFCKGNKADAEAYRQAGFFTESLLAVCVECLRDINVGELQNRDTSIAITHIEDALLRLGKRASDRQIRGVQGTYQK